MNNYALIPLITAVIFIPLLVMVVTNRPWQRQQKLFFFYLIAAMLWSASSFLFHSNIFVQHELLAEITIGIGVLMGVQLHYFLRSLYQGQGAKIPYAYAILAGAIVLAVLGYIPAGVKTTGISFSIDYGIWFIAIVVIISILLGRDIYLLARRQRTLTDPGERNQMNYLFAGLTALLIPLLIGFTAPASKYPTAHIGNFIMAGILSYAVITRQLLDIKVILRRGLVWLIASISAIAAYFILFFLLHLIFGFDISLTTMLAAIGATAWVAMFAYWMLTILSPGLEQTLAGEKYKLRRQLLDLASKIDSVSTLQEWGDKLISLLSQSTDCRRACLLLPKSEGGDFIVISSYSPKEDDPIQKLNLKQDSIITTWLKQEAHFLPKTLLALQPNIMNQQEYKDIQSAKVEIFFPLVNHDRLVAILAMGEKRNGKFYNIEDIGLVDSVVTQIVSIMERQYLYEQLEQKARIDDLTGLFNRHHFKERLEEEIARHSRYGGIFSLLMLDLDFFKTYNDVYGHLAGDNILRQIGEIIRNSMRSGDQAFRYGGDEFTLILPETNIDDAYLVAERVREEIATKMGARSVALTCSIGLIQYPSSGATFDELVWTADAALYYAKSRGGNQSHIHSRIPPQPTMVSHDTTGASLSAVYALTSVVESRDHYTYGHSQAVNYYAVALARAIKLPSEEISKIGAAASLHDVGKIGITDDILNKKGKFNQEDWKIIKPHSKLGASIVGSIPSLVPCVPAILYHHEHYDGSGYPEGLKGNDIPLEARILAIADAFSAMLLARPYRDALSQKQAIEELKRNAGTQFDPELVEIFINLVIKPELAPK